MSGWATRSTSSTRTSRRPASASATSRSDGFADWGADMAFDRARNLIWQVNVGGDNGIYGLDPADGSVSPEDHRLAVGRDQPARPRLRPCSRCLLHRRLERGHRLSRGRPVARRRPARPSRSAARRIRTSPVSPGTAPSGCCGRQTNSDTDTIWRSTRSPVRRRAGIAHPDGGGFGGAGIELDVAGNIWTVGQNSRQRLPRRLRPPDLQRRPVADRDADRRPRSRPTARSTSTSRSTRPGSPPTSTAPWWRSRPTIPTTRSCRCPIDARRHRRSSRASTPAATDLHRRRR